MTNGIRTLDWPSLAKYPVVLLTIVVGLWVAQTCFDIQLSRLTKIGPGGIELQLQEAQVATATAATELDTQLKDLKARVERLEGANPALASRPALATESTATVSDAIARIQTVVAPLGDFKGPPLRGYIWIGNYSEQTRRWNNPILGDGRRPIADAPSTIKLGDEFTVRGNVVVRDGLPLNDKLYYRARKSVGVLPSGTRVRILAAPVDIDREVFVQYWAQVETVR